MVFSLRGALGESNDSIYMWNVWFEDKEEGVHWTWDTENSWALPVCGLSYWVFWIYLSYLLALTIQGSSVLGAGRLMLLVTLVSITHDGIRLAALVYLFPSVFSKGSWTYSSLRGRMNRMNPFQSLNRHTVCFTLLVFSYTNHPLLPLWVSSPFANVPWVFGSTFHAIVYLVASVMSNSLWPYAPGPPGSSVRGILQARILEWVAMTSFRGSSQSRDWTGISMSPALAGRFFTTSTTWEVLHAIKIAEY